MNTHIKKIIIDTINKDGNRRIPPAVLARKILDNRNPFSKHQIYQVIDNMIAVGELKRTNDNKVFLGYIDAPVDMSCFYEGIIFINSQKDGFIKQFDESGNVIEEFYVNKIHLNTAMHRDKVKFALLKKDNIQNLREASIIDIIERYKKHLVAEIIFNNNVVNVIADDTRLYFDIIVTNLEIASSHDKVILEIIRFEKCTITTKIIKVLGNNTNIGIDILSSIYENGVEIKFDDESIKESEGLKYDLTDAQLLLRKDLRNKKIITIDPETSKDLDDAIYLEKDSNGNYDLYVAIADVSHYVQPDTSLNQTAYNRGTSVYLVDRVIPMLPNNISDNLCSLNPNEEKFALVAQMKINNQGEFITYDVYPAIIINHRRFSYDEVNNYFNHNILNNCDNHIHSELDACYELHKILRERKKKLGYIEFEIKEPKIVLDEFGVPIRIDVKSSGTAQKMIEDFMVCANEAVTLFAKDNNLDFIYRIHDKPTPKKIDWFKVESKKIGLSFQIDSNNLESSQLLNILNKNKDHENYLLLNQIMLRTMQKAEYSIRNIGHFGLSIQNYTHFTSPIRRYSDLIVHRLFWMNIFNPSLYTDQQRIELKQQLEDITKQCNMTEIRQQICERDVNAMKFAEYMTHHIGEKFTGRITSVMTFGLFVELDNLVEGFVSIKSLGDDFYVFNPETYTIMGQRSNRIYTFGKQVEVEVVSASKQERKIDFKIVN